MEPLLELLHAVGAQAAAGALIGHRGVREPVADHPFAGGQRGPNQALEMIAARGEGEERLGPRVGGLVQEPVADRLAELGPARLARHHHGDAVIPQPLGAAAEVSALAGAVDALEGDEAPGQRTALLHRALRW